MEAVWLASPSSFERWKMRPPIVRTMRQPPIDVPSVSAAPQLSLTQSGTVRELEVAGREQERGDHAHRLLGVVRCRG